MHTVGWGGMGGESAHLPHRQIFEKLVNKNAIKPKIGGPPWQFFLKALTPPRDFGKNFKYPPPPFWIFLCIYVWVKKLYVYNLNSTKITKIFVSFQVWKLFRVSFLPETFNWFVSCDCKLRGGTSSDHLNGGGNEIIIILIRGACKHTSTERKCLKFDIITSREAWKILRQKENVWIF